MAGEKGETQLPTTSAIAGARPAATAPVPPMRVRVVDGPDAGAVFAASADRFTIGTHERAELVLRDSTVSRFHCQVGVEDGRITVRDLGSRNGTLVDGVSILHAHLTDGATLRLGRTQLRFELGDEPVGMPVAEEPGFGGMVGGSVAMRAVFARLARAAASDATLLIEGETGTGKEVAAESVHASSARRAGPLVVVDCGAIPPDLLESELFGHERGAFTSAVSVRQGAFELAAGGTIFLDEIGELGPEVQPKLLRVLERREFKRVGGTRWAPVDVRVIAATNRSLRGEVNARRFRSDLYYRLAVLEVRLPPLRERPEDIPLLVEHVLGRLGLADRPEAGALRGEACHADLARHPWPGNVRELRNYIERCLALAERPPLGADPPGEGAEPDGALDFKAARESWHRDFEKRYLEELLARHGGNVSAAARSAGIDRKYLYRLLWRHGLR